MQYFTKRLQCSVNAVNALDKTVTYFELQYFQQSKQQMEQRVPYLFVNQIKLHCTHSKIFTFKFEMHNQIKQITD